MKELPWSESRQIFVHQLRTRDRFALFVGVDQTVFALVSSAWRDSKSVELRVKDGEVDTLDIVVFGNRAVYLFAPLPDLVYGYELVKGDKFSIYPSDDPMEVNAVYDGSKLDRTLTSNEWTFVFVDGTQYYSMRNDRRVYRHKPMREIE